MFAHGTLLPRARSLPHSPVIDFGLVRPSVLPDHPCRGLGIHVHLTRHHIPGTIKDLIYILNKYWMNKWVIG